MPRSESIGSRLWLAVPAAAAHFDPAHHSFADRKRWSRLGSGPARADWAASRALVAHVGLSRGRRSLSHSRGFAALATVPEGTRAGVDVEHADAGRDCMRLARFAFAAREAMQMQRLSTHERDERFYVLWTLKEAFIKALGLTLGNGLKHCVFTLEDGRWRAELPTTARYEARVYRPRPDLYLAAAAIEPPRHDLRWECREWPEAATGAWPMVLRLTADG